MLDLVHGNAKNYHTPSREQPKKEFQKLLEKNIETPVISLNFINNCIKIFLLILLFMIMKEIW